MDLNGTYYHKEPYQLDVARERSLTISSPFRHSPFSHKPKTLDQNQNASRPRPLSLLQHSNSNSLPPKLPSLSLSLSPTPPSSPSCASPHSSSYLVPRPNTPNSPSPCLRTPSSSFNFDIAEPAGPQKNRPFLLPLNLPKDDLLPPLDQPLPTRDWVSIEGDFVLVLALYQTHLGADLHAAPQARFDDGLIHLTFVRAGDLQSHSAETVLCHGKRNSPLRQLAVREPRNLPGLQAAASVYTGDAHGGWRTGALWAASSTGSSRHGSSHRW
ncbi:Sphingosine kinase 2 [Larimichthys crocea]|uniref:Uncharacterized protein n=1 Tax=Larimichthys crocea TaxID=215358 RepID=A0ACD3QTH0_LARCR|nr:Sphingosine kinase 2 [Larimichthys crocea]